MGVFNLREAAAPVTSKSRLTDLGNFTDHCSLSEAIVDTGNDEKGQPKREVELTAIQEGTGNRRDMRWYSRACIESLEALVYSRRKLFYDHQEAPGGADSIRNWCATIQKTWVVEDAAGVLHRKVRFKVQDQWLWERCVDPVARKELVLSIEGAGAGSKQTIAGEEYTVIEKIHHLTAFKFVPYGGNAKMGADLVEGAKPPTEDSMDFSKVTLEQLKEARPDLFAKIEADAQTKAAAAAEAATKQKLAEAAASGASKDQLAALTESFQKKLDEVKTAQTSAIKTLEERALAAEKKADGLEIRETLRGKRELVDRLVAESALVPEAKTPKFIARCYAITERKEGDKVLTVEEQVKAEIDEQVKLTTSNFGSVRESGAGPAKIAGSDNITEAEGQIGLQAALSGQDPLAAVEAHRTAEKARAAAAK